MKDKGKAEGVLTKLFGSTSRARILILLFEKVGRSFYQREIMYETSLSLQAVQRELNNLVELGMVKSDGKRYKARVVGGEVSEDLFKRGLCLPSGSQMTEEDLERVVNILRGCQG